MKSNEYTIGDLVLYKNQQLIAFNKPSGVAVQTQDETEKSLVDLAEIYAKSNVFITHRIDQPASGVVLLARTSKAVASINEQFKQRKIQKTYLAVVKQAPKEESGTLTHFLARQGNSNKSKIVEAKFPGAKEARLEYKVLDKIDNYSLLEIKLLSGRHHQIRVQLAAIGSPIKGDVKYGARRSNGDRSIHLHSWKITFEHPISHEAVALEAPVPNETVWQAFKFLNNG